MYYHRYFQLTAFFPNGVKAGVIHANYFALIVFVFKPKVLIYFQPSGAAFYILLQFFQRFVYPARLTKTSKGYIGKQHHPASIHCFYPVKAAYQVIIVIYVQFSVCVFITSAAKVNHYLHMQAVHFTYKFMYILAGHIPLVIVYINKRVFGPGKFMLRHHQGAWRVVGFKIHFLRCLAKNWLNKQYAGYYSY